MQAALTSQQVFPFDFAAFGDLGPGGGNGRSVGAAKRDVSDVDRFYSMVDSRSWRNVKETHRAYCAEAIAQGDESAALRQQHEQTIQAFEEERIFFRFEELESED